VLDRAASHVCRTTHIHVVDAANRIGAGVVARVADRTASPRGSSMPMVFARRRTMTRTVVAIPGELARDVRSRDPFGSD